LELADKGVRLNKGKKQIRGRIESVTLKKPIVFNSNKITTALIEIDHINYGLDRKTTELNKNRRSNFSINDIEKFLALLDGEFLFPRSYKGRVSRFEHRVDCPINGRFFKKEFLMIFDTDYDNPSVIHTITIFPGW
jgi:hypothetical protein